MRKPLKSKFFQHPATKIGWWASILALVAILMLGTNMLGMNPFNHYPGDDLFFLVKIYDWTMFGSMVAAIILGVIALTLKRERSWLVFLFTIPASLILVFFTVMLIERFSYSERMEIAPTPNAAIDRLPIIFDDDGSPDGTSALLFLLSDPRADVKMVSVSYGEAHPQIYIQHLGWMLERFGYGSIPLSAGEDSPLAGSNAFPNSVREASNGFWGFSSGSEKTYTVQDSAELMVKTLKNSNEPVTLFISGSLTNLAQALRSDPSVQENIAAVYIMGGAVYVPGNIKGLLPASENLVAEWNVFVDPVAASEVFTSGMKLFLVPLDATNQVRLSKQNIDAWRKGGSIPDFAADIYISLMSAWNVQSIEMWDLVTAELMLNPEHCAFTPLRLIVDVTEGNSQGQTRVVEGEANVNVCLEPYSDAIKQTLENVFSSRK